MTRDELESAAFWECGVCLDCHSVVESESESCTACGSDQVMAARKVLLCLEVVDSPEEG